MNLHTQAQVRSLARSVGFTDFNARIISAIAMCEAPYSKDGVSYADFDAVGDQNLANDVWGYSYGGCQIRSLRAAKGTGGVRDETRLLEPTFNLRSARTIKLAAGSFRPWSTFTSGMYKAYLQDLFPPPPNTYVVVGGDTLSGIASKVAAGKWSWQELAAANKIEKPYVITIGQVLLLPHEHVGA